MARKKTVIRCSCSQCNFGIRHSWGRCQMRKTKHKLRYSIKRYLDAGEYDKALDVIVSAGYTD